MSDSEEEELGIITRLFDVLLGKTSATEEDVGEAIHRLDMKQRRARPAIYGARWECENK
jgi:hypothetical protein